MPRPILSKIEDRLSWDYALRRPPAFGWGVVDFIVSLFVMFYLLFFFPRDGGALSRRTDRVPM